MRSRNLRAIIRSPKGKTKSSSRTSSPRASPPLPGTSTAGMCVARGIARVHLLRVDRRLVEVARPVGAVEPRVPLGAAHPRLVGRAAETRGSDRRSSDACRPRRKKSAAVSLATTPSFSPDGRVAHRRSRRPGRARGASPGTGRSRCSRRSRRRRRGTPPPRRATRRSPWARAASRDVAKQDVDVDVLRARRGERRAQEREPEREPRDQAAQPADEHEHRRVLQPVEQVRRPGDARVRPEARRRRSPRSIAGADRRAMHRDAALARRQVRERAERRRP